MASKMMMTIISWLNGSARSLKKAMVGKSGGPAERLSYLFFQLDVIWIQYGNNFFVKKNVSSQKHFLYTGGK